MNTFNSNSVIETEQFGIKLASYLKQGDILGMKGDFGAGKTHLIKAICSYFEITPEKVTSPSFTLINEYIGSKNIVHIDTYRLKSDEEFELLDIDFYQSRGSIILIEWADMIQHLLPDHAKMIEIKVTGVTSREMILSDNIKIEGNT